MQRRISKIPTKCPKEKTYKTSETGISREKTSSGNKHTVLVVLKLAAVVAFPSRFYHDPANVLQYNDRYKSGCPACLHSRYFRKGDIWYCALHIQGFPKLGKDGCKSWKKSNKKSWEKRWDQIAQRS